tara:strand:+ start:923 stop:1657 length:735 start_codon:yes stop_codon:yes gene_type:complete
MKSNNTLQKLIDNEQLQLPDEFLCSRAKVKTKGVYQKINVNIDSIVSRYHITRYMRVGDRETFEETYRKNHFIPYLRILDLIKKYDLITCLQIDCRNGHFLYLARTMNIDCFGFNKDIDIKDKQIFTETFNSDCLIKFGLNYLHKLNHYFDVILSLYSSYDEIAFKQLLKIFSNKSGFAIVNINNSNYNLLKKYHFLEEIEHFNTNYNTIIVLIKFKGKQDINNLHKFNDNNEIIGLNREKLSV